MASSETYASSPSTPHYQIVSFGDSLSDVGTYAPAAASFGGGRFTTNPGEVWTQVLARSYGDCLTAAYTGGFGTPLIANPGGFGYGQGGARVERPIPFSGNTTLYAFSSDPNSLISPLQALRNTQANIASAEPGSGVGMGLSGTSITSQIRCYLDHHHQFNASQLVLMNGGGNDILANASAAAIGDIPFPEAIKAIQTAAIQYAGLIQTVYENGAQNLITTNIPDLGHTPIGATDLETSTVLTELSILFNTTFMQSLEASLPAEHTVITIDAFAFINQMLQTYQEHGFSVSNTSIACKLGLLPECYQSALFCSPALYVEPNADQTYMFADSVHPSSHLHALFAEHVKEQFEASLAHRSNLSIAAA